MKRTSTPSGITPGQKEKFQSVVKDASRHGTALAFEKIEVDSDGWQRVIEHGDELCTAIAEIIVSKTRELSVNNQFADEEVKSSYGYLSGYEPKGLSEQINRPQELFPGLGNANQNLLTQIEKGGVELPKYTEGWFAIPNWIKNPCIFGTTYSEALQKVLDKIRETRNGKFYNYREGEIDEKHIRQSARTKKFFHELSKTQGHPDILIVPAQFGIRYPQGNGTHIVASVRRAREKFISNEFGLGAFAVCVMVLTHPERLMNYDDLWIDCDGDEWSCEADGVFDHAPLFYFGGGEVKFGASKVDVVLKDYGSASGFLFPLP